MGDNISIASVNSCEYEQQQDEQVSLNCEYECRLENYMYIDILDLGI